MGSYWNLNWLIGKRLVTPPHVLTLFFNWPGGTWSPATPDEYLHRVKYMPEHSVYTISVMGEEQIRLALLAINTGGNVRVGTEDYPFIRPDVPAKHNGEIVARAVQVAKVLGRGVADPSEARKILGLK